MSANTWRGLNIAAFAAAVIVALLPEFTGAGLRDVAFTFLTYAVLAQAWNLIGGFGGQFSLGHSAFVGFGAYMCAWLLLNTPIPPIVAVIAAMLLVIPVAVAASFALFRLQGVYLSVGTLAMALAAAAWMSNWTVTGATQGLNIPFDRVLPDKAVYVLAVLLTAVATAFAQYFATSDFGLCVQAVRDDEEAASSVGVAAFPAKMIAFALSAALTSAMGALIALRQISIEPVSMFGIGWTITAIVMTVIGGIGTVWGPLLGALVVYFGIEKPLEGSQEIATLITGLLVIVIVRFLPHGLSDAFAQLRRLIDGTLHSGSLKTGAPPSIPSAPVET